jgi:hypothetical protein
MPYYRVYGKFKSGGKGDIRVMAMSEQGAMEKAIKEREFNPTSAEKYTNMPFPEQLEKVKKLNIEMPEGITYEELKSLIKAKEDYPFILRPSESLYNYILNKIPEEDEIRINKYADYMQLIELLFEHSENKIEDRVILLIFLALNNCDKYAYIREIKESWDIKVQETITNNLLLDDKFTKALLKYKLDDFMFAGELKADNGRTLLVGNNMKNYAYKTVQDWIIIKNIK